MGNQVKNELKAIRKSCKLVFPRDVACTQTTRWSASGLVSMCVSLCLLVCVCVCAYFCSYCKSGPGSGVWINAFLLGVGHLPTGCRVFCLLSVDSVFRGSWPQTVSDDPCPAPHTFLSFIHPWIRDLKTQSVLFLCWAACQLTLFGDIVTFAWSIFLQNY